MDEQAAERLAAAWVRRKRFEALLLAGALAGGGRQAQPVAGGFDTMMDWLG